MKHGTVARLEHVDVERDVDAASAPSSTRPRSSSIPVAPPCRRARAGRELAPTSATSPAGTAALVDRHPQRHSPGVPGWRSSPACSGRRVRRARPRRGGRPDARARGSRRCGRSSSHRARAAAAGRPRRAPRTALRASRPRRRAPPGREGRSPQPRPWTPLRRPTPVGLGRAPRRTPSRSCGTRSRRRTRRRSGCGSGGTGPGGSSPRDCRGPRRPSGRCRPELLLPHVRLPEHFHPRALVEPRRTGGVLGVDAEGDGRLPGLPEPAERLPEQRQAEAPPAPALANPEDPDPAPVAVPLRVVERERDHLVPRPDDRHE